MSSQRTISLFLAGIFLAACTTAVAAPTPTPVPEPVCGGIEIAIPRAISCKDAANRALAALREKAPQQIARGVTGIQVQLAECPRNEVPPQMDCTGEQFAYLVTVHFNVLGDNLFMEDNLTVGVAPVSGRILGIANPLVR
jgi:hypothetical protein